MAKAIGQWSLRQPATLVIALLEVIAEYWYNTSPAIPLPTLCIITLPKATPSPETRWIQFFNIAGASLCPGGWHPYATRRKFGSTEIILFPQLAIAKASPVTATLTARPPAMIPIQTPLIRPPTGWSNSALVFAGVQN